MPMPDPAAGPSNSVHLRLLESIREIDDDELHRLYSYPGHPPARWLRANFITSLDGGATVEGRSGGLAGPGDRALFHLLRALADVIVVGAGTVRTENYGGAQLSVARRQQRQNRGQTEVPQLAVVTNSGLLDRDLPLFTRTEVPPLVLTCTASADDTAQRLAGLADVLDCAGDDPHRVDERTALAALERRGLTRVLTEGGPTLLDSFVGQDLLDELCLTIAPCVVGGQARRIVSGTGQILTRMRCAHVLTDEAGYLYTRYLRSE